jgi:anti-sigma regulatory factor (Ser/Thr protein kinase)
LDSGTTAIEDQGHVVQFYDHDAELVAAVASYIGEAIENQERAVVIATPAHTRALLAAMTDDGIDVGAAQQSGTLLALDAATVLAQFVVEGRPDAELFERSVGTIVRGAAAGGLAVRAFGEMVALLWDAGDVAGAIELETLWNELGRQVPFTLFCAYHAASVGGEHHAASFAEICHLHSRVLTRPSADDDVVIVLDDARGSADLRRSFAADARAPRAARQFVIDTLEQSGCGALTDDAAVVIAELASNAVEHAHSGFTVALSRDGRTVRIAVTDGAANPPTPRDPSLLASSGRGLAMVSALAARWGADPLVDGKVVWAELVS